MPPRLAALICVILILYLFWIDRKNNEGVSHAIWIPFIWVVLAGSRFVSHWLNLAPPMSEDAYFEGSPVDRAVFAILIISGIIVLARRRLNWNELFKANIWIWLFFLYGTISILWSDYPFVSLKRLIKTLGTVVMGLIILTEVRPFKALGVILRRFSYLLLPLSVLFIKYYPDLGRAYHMGVPMYTGVAMQKNGLGNICLLSSIYFSWNLLFGRSEMNAQGQRLHYSVYLIILPMIAWLLYMANSATSFACVVVALCLFGVARVPSMAREPRRIITFSIACMVLYGAIQLAFDVNDDVIALLGRRPDLTNRVPMWEFLLAMVKNPLIGCGFESFWLGSRQELVVEKWGIGLQAHNGYLQMYLDLGYIGVSFIVVWILSGLKKVLNALPVDYPIAIIRFCLILVVVFYNYTEAAFYGVNNNWLIFLIGIIDAPGQQMREQTDSSFFIPVRDRIVQQEKRG